ncbi:MAG: hypothetical protein RLZZ324_190 [Candidatus Parcubacteria bacterium]|jgi:hypothetical protein
MSTFDKYATPEQQSQVAAALAQEGYAVRIVQHGGWGGGTEYRIRRGPERADRMLNQAVIAATIVLCILSTIFLRKDGLYLTLDGFGAMIIVVALVNLRAVFSARFILHDNEPVWKLLDARGSRYETTDVAELLHEKSGVRVDLSS